MNHDRKNTTPDRCTGAVSYSLTDAGNDMMYTVLPRPAHAQNEIRNCNHHDNYCIIPVAPEGVFLGLTDHDRFCISYSGKEDDNKRVVGN